MKHLLSIALATGLAATATAQAPQNRSLMLSGSKYTVGQTPRATFTNNIADLKASESGSKTTAATNRYYNQSDAIVAASINPNLQDQANLSIIQMWFDSTVRQRFNTGLGTINFSSINQYFDPVRSDLFNDVANFPNEMRVGSTNAYRVDSVSFFAAYIRRANKTAIVDTLIMSVAAGNNRYALPKASYPQYPLASYIPTKDTLYGFTVGNVDSLNRAALGDLTPATRTLWKVPLTAAMGDQPDPTTGDLTLRRFSFAVPNGGYNVTANSGFNVTVTFKSGDTWVRNVDTIGAFNSWRPVSYGTSAAMPYYYYDFGRDRNMSGLLFSTDTSSYLPSVITEAINAPSFDFEFHDITAYVTCSTCTTVIAANVNDAALATVGTAFPNPAKENVTIPVTLSQAADLSVSLSNTTGQVISTQNLGRAQAGQTQRAVFSTSSLAPGVYFYTVTAGSTSKTGRFVVGH